MKNCMIAIACLFTACKDVPPPINEGRCVIDTYEGKQAIEQNCNWAGFSYSCTYSSDDGYRCKRTGEAAGERPALK